MDRVFQLPPTTYIGGPERSLPLREIIERLEVRTVCSTFIPNKKAQLSLTNLRDVKACQKLIQFDVLTTLSLTVLVGLSSFV